MINMTDEFIDDEPHIYTNSTHYGYIRMDHRSSQI